MIILKCYQVDQVMADGTV